MATLLLRLSAPLQAWGDESKYDIRQTCREPSKSGVIGMLAAALGLKRDSDEIVRLSDALRMGVRVDMPGKVIVDFHTAFAPSYSKNGDLRYDSDGEIVMSDSPYVTYRYYLCDAAFLTGLESQDEILLDRLAKAVQNPCYPLYLGRRSCPPAGPLFLGVRASSLEETLRREPWIASDWYKRSHSASRLRMILETERGETAWHSLRDNPVSFSPEHRRFAHRGIKPEQFVALSDEHDPMLELQDI